MCLLQKLEWHVDSQAGNTMLHQAKYNTVLHDAVRSYNTVPLVPVIRKK